MWQLKCLADVAAVNKRHSSLTLKLLLLICSSFTAVAALTECRKHPSSKTDKDGLVQKEYASGHHYTNSCQTVKLCKSKKLHLWGPILYKISLKCFKTFYLTDFKEVNTISRMYATKRKAKKQMKLILAQLSSDQEYYLT